MATRDRIVGLLYEAAVNPTLWSQALGALSDATGSGGAHLIVLDRKTLVPRGGFIGGPVIDPETLKLYGGYYRQLDPLIPAVAAADVDHRAMLCHEFVEQASVAKSEYYQDFLIPMNGRYMAGWNLERTAERVTVLGLHKRKTRFERAGLAEWDSISIHAGRAVQLGAKLGFRTAQGQMFRQAVDSQEVACIMVDADCRVLDCSQAAHKYLQSGSILKLLPNGRLGTSSLEVTKRLRALVSQATTGCGGGFFNPAPALRTESWIAQVVPGGVATDNPFDPRCAGCALVFLDPPALVAKPDWRRLQSMLGCTESEARVAVLLVEGHTPEDIA